MFNQLGIHYLAFIIYIIYKYIYISFIGISECMLLSSGARHRSCMFMAQACGWDVAYSRYGEEAMLSIGGDGDAEWGQVSGIAASPLTTGLNRLAGRFARQFFTKHLGCMGSPVRTMAREACEDANSWRVQIAAGNASVRLCDVEKGRGSMAEIYFGFWWVQPIAPQ